LPHGEEGIQEVAKKLNADPRKVRERIDALHEFNPMLGFRGCRLGIMYPEITEMQARAIFKAAIAVKKEGVDVKPEVMIPLINGEEELKMQEALVREIAETEMKAAGVQFEYLVGTMIELPRAALTADKVARTAEFFSFGTNDLTQTCMGLSRDDSGRFLPPYVEKKIFVDDPFQSIDQEGVGQLVKTGVDLGRKTNPNLKIGICGEHGGDPSSVTFFYRIGLNYVSCSPYRVPIARLAAAQASLERYTPKGTGPTARDK
jgi:pyruvate,orthophosphate dikinase